jgi:hypothetical protein
MVKHAPRNCNLPPVRSRNLGQKAPFTIASDCNVALRECKARPLRDVTYPKFTRRRPKRLLEKVRYGAQALHDIDMIVRKPDLSRDAPHYRGGVAKVRASSIGGETHLWRPGVFRNRHRGT